MASTPNSEYKIVLPSVGIYYNLRGTRSPLGPISFKELQKKFFAREINSTTYVWHKTLSNWITLGECRDFDVLPGKTPIEVSSLGHDHDIGKTITASLNNQEKIFKLNQVAQAIRDGYITPSTPVFSYGVNKWIRAGHHESLLSIFKRISVEKNGPQLNNESLETSGVIFDEDIGLTESTKSLKPEINDDSVLSLNIPKLNVKKTTINSSIPPLVNQTVSTKVPIKEKVRSSEGKIAPKITKSEYENPLKQRNDSNPKGTSQKSILSQMVFSLKGFSCAIKKVFSVKDDNSKSKMPESVKPSVMLWFWAITLMVLAFVISSLAYFPDKVMSFIERFSFFQTFFNFFM